MYGSNKNITFAIHVDNSGAIIAAVDTSGVFIVVIDKVLTISTNSPHAAPPW